MQLLERKFSDTLNTFETACICAGESFAELSENARAPAIGTVRKVNISLHISVRHHACRHETVGLYVMQAVPVITADEFQKMSLQDDSDLLVVLDVRSEDEYRSG